MTPSTILPFLLLLLRESIVAYQLKTKLGVLDGDDEIESRGGQPFYAFFNVPYAKPPVGELRFEPPQDPEPWDGVRDATVPSIPCVQTFRILFSLSGETHPIGQEDCLYLDVFTPDVAPSTLLPVMVYIHGGGFTCGASFPFGPEYFMDYPVILVVIQYRLNVYGFLSAVDEVIPGNYGIKDQVAALKWIQNNIESFGGNPKRVTIVGNSAGATSVHLHMHSPLSTGLFHQGISESGSAFAAWSAVRPEVIKRRTYALGMFVGCQQSDSKALLKCLKQVPSVQLSLAHDKLYVFDSVPMSIFGVVIEPKSVKNAFLTDNPWKRNVINNVPWIVGGNMDEGNVIASRVFSTEANLEEWNRDFDRMLSLTLGYDNKENSSVITAAVRKFYLEGNDITHQNLRKFSEIFRDSFFVVDCLEAARRHENKVFYYLFDHRYFFTTDIVFGNLTEDMGVGHTDELIGFYQLNGILPPITEDEADDYAVSKKMCSYWVNFAQTGDPNGNGPKIWQPFSKETFDYLHIKTESDVMEKNLFRDRYKFWMNLLYSSPDHQLSSGKGS